MNHLWVSCLQNYIHVNDLLNIHVAKARYCCLRCLTPNNEFDTTAEQTTSTKLRTSMGTRKALREIKSTRNIKEREAMKQKLGLNGVNSIFLLLPNLGEDFPNCFAPGIPLYYCY